MKRIALFCLRIYQRISSNFPKHCIYTPTCSEYAKEAFGKYSFPKATMISFLRILRCNPLAKGGVDFLK